MSQEKTNRFSRALILLIITMFLFAFSISDTVMKFIYPQMQIAIVGVIKSVFGALVGYLLGLFLFPHKIDWAKDNILTAGAIARLVIILFISYVAYNYA